MKKIFAAIPFLILTFSLFAQQIVDEQLRYQRVREAKADYHDNLRYLFDAKDVAFPPKEIYVRAFKFDKELELWAKDGDTFTHIKTYDICRVSGELGPKRQQGDLQIPEGVYNLEHFNPTSSYHLSMKVDYPNKADRILGSEGRLGGDIFIHGECVTIGCIPLENEPIKELYWLSVLANGEGAQIPIHIFPFKMDNESLSFFERIPLFEESDWEFWDQLKPIYNYFEKNKLIPQVDVLSNGKYILTNNDNLVNN